MELISIIVSSAGVVVMLIVNTLSIRRINESNHNRKIQSETLMAKEVKDLRAAVDEIKVSVKEATNAAREMREHCGQTVATFTEKHSQHEARLKKLEDKRREN